MSGHVIADDAFKTRECMDCGEIAVRRRLETQGFLYGKGENAVELHADVPVWTCGRCGSAYTDGAAEDLRHDAVCEHLRVLPPASIQELREQLGLTQTRLSELTGIGEASIKRWEAGALIQNRSADTLLRLLRIPAGRDLIEGVAIQRDGLARAPRFRTELPEGARREASVFVLRSAAR